MILWFRFFLDSPLLKRSCNRNWRIQFTVVSKASLLYIDCTSKTVLNYFFPFRMSCLWEHLRDFGRSSITNESWRLMTVHRITELHGLEETLKICSSNPLLWVGLPPPPPRLGCPGLGLERLQGRSIQSFPGQPVPVPHHPLSKKFPLNII